MNIAFIADLHLSAQRPASTELFKFFLATAARDLSQLYILGDLFDYWVGDDGSEILGHLEVEAAIKKAAANFEIFFLPGNRDFLIGEEFARRSGCKLLADPTTITINNQPIILTHGDQLCTDDTEHQQSRAQMLSAKWKYVFLNQPLDQRIKTATDMRATSEQDKQTKSREIMDVNQTAVEELLRAHNSHTLIHGHTHLPAVHNFNLDGATATRYVLGDWYEQSSVLHCDNGKFSLKN